MVSVGASYTGERWVSSALSCEGLSIEAKFARGRAFANGTFAAEMAIFCRFGALNSGCSEALKLFLHDWVSTDALPTWWLVS